MLRQEQTVEESQLEKCKEETGMKCNMLDLKNDAQLELASSSRRFFLIGNRTFMNVVKEDMRRKGCGGQSQMETENWLWSPLKGSS